MIKSLFAKPLKLELEGRSISFRAVGDFDFALASRTEVPATKVAELVQLTPEDLRSEATSIREVERRFVEVVARSLEEPGSVGYLLRELDLKLFSQDHEWRAIIQALIGQPDAAPNASPDKFRETLIFDVAEPQVREETVSRFERLARGETVAVGVIGDRLEIILSRHRFSLQPGSPARLFDENGPEYELASGRNVVGRMPGMEVVVDAGYRDVSRKHLVIETSNSSYVLLTDLSSHGTFVPRGTLEVARRRQ